MLWGGPHRSSTHSPDSEPPISMVGYLPCDTVSFSRTQTGSHFLLYHHHQQPHSRSWWEGCPGVSSVDRNHPEDEGIEAELPSPSARYTLQSTQSFSSREPSTLWLTSMLKFTECPSYPQDRVLFRARGCVGYFLLCLQPQSYSWLLEWGEIWRRQ